ncbi:MAG TPA: hypothetical protein VNX28_14625 [Gemmataceae bacterium]|jgi:hypothetical protein|nr:hypothetical protein [Gemmataceae bacterium]
MRRGSLILVLLGVLASMGAQFRTTNFLVDAPTPQIAQQIGQYAEQYRRDRAIAWLGREMPTWPQPCPLHVQINMEGPSGATSFHFGQGQVLSMKMEIQGPLDRLLASVLPHEITHTVFAYYFRQPVPRWADEGGSVLSEDELERDRHDKLTRSILNQGRQIPLRRLLSLKEYPREVMCLYAQGFSMSDYLVKRSDRHTFLAFIAQGMQSGWDGAAQSYYGHRSVEELEEAWLKHLRDTKLQPDILLAKEQGKTPGMQTGRNIVRLTAPPVQPLDPSPVVRGQMANNDQVGQRFATPSTNPDSGWQPVYPIPADPVRSAPLPAAVPTQQAPIPVRLGTPQFGPVSNQVPAGASPVGFPQQ